MTSPQGLWTWRAFSTYFPITGVHRASSTSVSGPTRHEHCVHGFLAEIHQGQRRDLSHQNRSATAWAGTVTSAIAFPCDDLSTVRCESTFRTKRSAVPSIWKDFLFYQALTRARGWQSASVGGQSTGEVSTECRHLSVLRHCGCREMPSFSILV